MRNFRRLTLSIIVAAFILCTAFVQQSTVFKIIGTGGDYATLSAAATALNADGNRWDLLLGPNAGAQAGGGVTLNSNITLRVLPGASITVANGTTLTINGPFQAGLHQVFACTGTGKVNFGRGAVSELSPQWWGAIGTGDTSAGTLTTNNAALLSCVTTAVDSAAATGLASLYTSIPIRLSGLYYTTANLVLADSNKILGTNRTGDGFIIGSDGTGTFITLGSDGVLKDFCILAKDGLVAAPYTYGISVTNEQMWTIEQLRMQYVGTDSAIYVASTGGSNSHSFKIERCDIQYGNHGIRFHGADNNNATAMWIRHNRIQNNGGVGIYSPSAYYLGGTIDANNLEGNSKGAADIFYVQGLTFTNNYGEQVYTDNLAPYRFGSDTYNGAGYAGNVNYLTCVGNSCSVPDADYLFDFGVARYTIVKSSVIKGNSGTWTSSIPTAPTAAMSTTAGSVTEGEHIIRVSFLTGAAEGITGYDATVYCSGGKQISLTSVPTGGAGVTDRNIYMTKAGGDVAYLVGAVGDNTTTTYTINTADASLSTASPFAGMAVGQAINTVLASNNFGGMCPQNYKINLGTASVEDHFTGRRGLSLFHQGKNILELKQNGSIVGFAPNPIDRWNNDSWDYYDVGQIIPVATGTTGDPAFFVCTTAGKLHRAGETIGTTNGSANITISPSAYTWAAGDIIKSADIPAGTKLLTIDGASGVGTISQNATASASGKVVYDAVFAPVGQIGFRTGGASPSGSVTPKFIGEVYLDTTNHVSYTAFGMTSSDWY